MSTLPMNRGYGQPNDSSVLMQDVSQQRKLAEQLRQQGSQDLQGQMVSGHYVAPAWSQQLARVLQSGLGGYLDRDSNKKESEYGAAKAKKFADILSGNKPQQIEGAPTVTNSMPAYTPAQQDQFGSPLPNVQRDPVQTVTPNMTQETPEQQMQRVQPQVLEYMQQYGNTPEGQYLLSQLGKQDDRAYAQGQKVEDRTYQAQNEEKLYNRGRTDKLSDVDAQRKYEDIVRKDTQGFQTTQQDKQFAQQYKMQAQSQGFQAGQNASNQAFQHNENALSRQSALDVAGAKANPKNKGLSVTAQKELFDAEDGIQGSRVAIDAFDKALKLNDKAMGGLGAGTLAKLGTALPSSMRPSTVDATKELDNVLQGSALPQLKAIFGGMPTEGERAILLEVQGSSEQPASVRKGIFERAKAAANQRIQYNQEKAKQLRNGTYFTEDGGINVAPASNSTNGNGWGIEVVK